VNTALSALTPVRREQWAWVAWPISFRSLRVPWRSVDGIQQIQCSPRPYNDYGAAEHLERNPKILRRYGYTVNDVDLIADWFSRTRR